MHRHPQRAVAQRRSAPSFTLRAARTARTFDRSSRLDALGAAARAAADLGRAGPRILKQLDRATVLTHDADASSTAGSVRPTRARLRRARRLVSTARALLAPRSRRGSVTAEVSALADDARAIGDDPKTLRVQVHCPES